jgi:hypothetical protein
VLITINRFIVELSHQWVTVGQILRKLNNY